MIFSTITQDELTLSVDSYNLPTQNSNNIQLKFVQDNVNYNGYTPTVAMALLDSSLVSCADVLNQGGFVPLESDGTFLVQNNILSQNGFLAVAINLTNTVNEVTENIMLGPVVYKIQANISSLSPLPSDDELWQSVVTAFLQSVYDNNYKPQFDQIQQDLENIVTEAENQQQQVANAIANTGQYQIVSNDPVQIQFKQGDGTYGQTVDLGDGLASKSMVNAGYYQSIATQYSGSASDYGIEVAQIIGAYEQDGTPTPEAPIEPQFVEINNFNTNGGNLFDASKLPSKTQGGATITNNGDGSFTVSGSGKLTESIQNFVELTHEQTVKLFKAGQLKIYFNSVSNPYCLVASINGSGKINEQTNMSEDGLKIIEITQENINDPSFYIRFGFFGINGKDIKASIIKPVLYQDGDGTFYPYNVSNLPLNKTYRALPNGVYDYHKDGVDTFNVGYVEFDGSPDENIMLETANDSKIPYHYQFYCALNGIKNNSAAIIDKGVFLPLGTFPTQQDNFSVVIGSVFNMFIPKEYLQEKSVSAFKTWLQSNPIKVWYQLATPTTEQNNIILKSFYPFTNAWNDSPLQPQITWNVLTGRSAILDGLGNLIQEAPMTAPTPININSDFQIWQRGESISMSSSNVQNGVNYFADMWFINYNSTNSPTYTFSRVDDGMKIQTNQTNVPISQFLSNPLTIGEDYIFIASINNTIYSLNIVGGTSNSNSNLQYQTGSGSDRINVLGLNNNDIVNFARLFHGNVLYYANKEPFSIALLRCQRKIRQYDTLCFVINYDYTQGKYMACCNIEKMDDIPTFTHGQILYYNTSGTTQNGTGESKTAYTTYLTITVQNVVNMNAGSNVLFVNNVLLSCEPLS